jgi:hypothetical protein
MSRPLASGDERAVLGAAIVALLALDAGIDRVRDRLVRGNEAGLGPFPQIRLAGLGECGTRAILGAVTSGRPQTRTAISESESLPKMALSPLILSLVGDLELLHVAGPRRSYTKEKEHAEDRFAGAYRGQARVPGPGGERAARRAAVG